MSEIHENKNGTRSYNDYMFNRHMSGLMAKKNTRDPTALASFQTPSTLVKEIKPRYQSLEHLTVTGSSATTLPVMIDSHRKGNDLLPYSIATSDNTKYARKNTTARIKAINSRVYDDDE